MHYYLHCFTVMKKEAANCRNQRCRFDSKPQIKNSVSVSMAGIHTHIHDGNNNNNNNTSRDRGNLPANAQKLLLT